MIRRIVIVVACLVAALGVGLALFTTRGDQVGGAPEAGGPGLADEGVARDDVVTAPLAVPEPAEVVELPAAPSARPASGEAGPMAEASAAHAGGGGDAPTDPAATGRGGGLAGHGGRARRASGSASGFARPPSEPPSLAQRTPIQRLLTAGIVSDADHFASFQSFLDRQHQLDASFGLATSRRVRMQVRDRAGKPVYGAEVRVRVGEKIVRGTTYADGVWDFFPDLTGAPGTGMAHVEVAHAGERTETEVRLPARGESASVPFALRDSLSAPPRALDLAFLIDVTGSMADELRYVNDEIVGIVERVHRSTDDVDVRVGATFYRDREDAQPIQRIAFTGDEASFAREMTSIEASGGGDYPEDLNLGLSTALSDQGWRAGAAKVLIVISDAPPQSYQDVQYTYADAARHASVHGIRILPVAASGANRELEVIFRALGVVTSTPYVYLTDHSGVGGSHLVADTERRNVEMLSDLLTRLLTSDLAGRGMHEATFQS